MRAAAATHTRAVLLRAQAHAQAAVPCTGQEHNRLISLEK